MTEILELGLDTFGDVTTGDNGKAKTYAQVIRDVIDEAVLADEVGVDFTGLGEHHRADFAISSPEIILAAIAGRTKRIKLGSAVTVLSSDDPIRVACFGSLSWPAKSRLPGGASLALISVRLSVNMINEGQ